MESNKSETNGPDPSLKRPLEEPQLEAPRTEQPILPGDSTITKAEKIESQAVENESESPSRKRARIDPPVNLSVDSRDRVKGIAPVKAECVHSSRTSVALANLKRFLITKSKLSTSSNGPADDDEAEGRNGKDSRDNGSMNKKKQKGQNKDRQFGSFYDSIRLCNSRANSSEFSPKDCSFGEKCRTSHDLRLYLAKGKREDITTFGGKCPVWEFYGRCHASFKCRFARSHSKEITHEDGRKELVLIEDLSKIKHLLDDDDESREGVHNVASTADKLDLARKRTKTEKSDQYNKWIDDSAKIADKLYNLPKDASEESRQERRAQFIEPPFLPSEKRRIYFGPETPVLAPLTTQGNMPFRRMCVDFGAQLTYSEMAMTLPILQGSKSEWALMKAHESEISPPRFTPASIVQDYDNSKDLKFGVQISANKPWQAIKGAEVISRFVPYTRVIDLNCGCPIDLVYKTGAGSALLDAHSKLEKMIRGMNAVSGAVPITAKIRMGTMTGKPNASKTIERLAFGGPDTREMLGAPGCAAITLHGRSRQQRYTKTADWSYIAECAALIKSYNDKKDELTDTIKEPDARTQANSKDGKLYFIGNGDCYSQVDYLDHIQNAGVDSVMVARGALIKPWIFEEIEKGQYLDKSATERLGYIEKFCRYGLESWGSDEVGVGQTRRFLLEWLSFAHRYVPIGVLEHLPPSLQDRPPAYRGRDDMETLLASDNYLDWIKIR